jgi:threonine/homoserine/homoserine lactone efflux protein
MPSTDLNTAAALFSVAAIWTVAVITPGPNFLLTAQTAMARSRTAALWNVLGIVCGAVVWGLCGFLGLSLLFQAAPWLWGALKLLGGVYLIYLGIVLMVRRSPDSFCIENPEPIRSGGFAAWRTGLLTNLTNPKTAAFVTSLFAASMPGNPPVWLGLASVVLMTMLSATWYAAVALIFSTSKCTDLYQRGRHWIDRFAGMIFMAFGARLVADR